MLKCKVNSTVNRFFIMRIAQLESRTGVGRHTLRYYEQDALLPGIQRRANNYRDYPESAVRQVELIRQLQSFGFSLSEIRTILNGIQSNEVDCAQGAQLLAEKRLDIHKQIRQLRQVDKLLAAEQVRLEESAARQACNVSEQFS